jgi:hypothetical protein
MFELGQRVVCVKPAEGVWFGDMESGFRPKNVPESGGVYTIREVVMGSTVPGGPHWTKAPGLVGLIFEEVVNERRLTTNGEDQEQAFDEHEFMPLDEREETQDTRIEVNACAGA